MTMTSTVRSAQHLLGTRCWAQAQQHPVPIGKCSPSLQGRKAISDGVTAARTWGDFQDEVKIVLCEAPGAVTEVCGLTEAQRVGAAEERLQS